MSSTTLSNLSKISNSFTQEQRNTALDSLFQGNWYNLILSVKSHSEPYPEPSWSWPIRLEPIKALKIIQDDTNLIYENTVIIDIMSMISVILKCSTQSSPKIQAILKVSSKFMNTNNDTVQIIASRIDFLIFLKTHIGTSLLPLFSLKIFEFFFLKSLKRIIQQTFKILKTNEWLKEISDNNIFQSVITLLSQVVTQRNGYRF